MEARKVRRADLRCGRLVVRRVGGVSIRNGFGKGSLVGCRASRPVWRLVCRPRLVRVGSARMVVWHHFLSSLFRGAVYLLWSEKRSRFSTPASVGCVRSPASLGRCASTISRELRRNAATRGGGLEYRATTAQWHSDRRASRPKVAKLAENDKPFAGMSKIVSAVLSPAPMASWYQALRCAGWVAVMGPERIDGGRHRGALSRSRTGSGSISPTMSP